MNTITGRQEEKKELHDAFTSKKAELIIVYGRRRVGKTYLINEYFNQCRCLFLSATGIQNGTLKDQLLEFAKSIGKTFYNGASISPALTWLNTFEELNKGISARKRGKKVVLFFDEFPWMVTKRSRLLQAFDYYWNHYWCKDPDIKVIICGSSASWIIKNIIHHTGGLHNRNTRSILLKPFTLLETKDFLEQTGNQLNNKQVLQIYMAMGG